jgi:hypothetical protein
VLNVHVSPACALPVEARSPAGTGGTVVIESGVADASADGALCPALLTATTT